MATAKKIKELRRFRNMTQQALSDSVGISVRLIQKYESGERTPKEENKEKLARALNVSCRALAESNLNTCEDVMATLFELEKEYGEIIIETIGSRIAVCIDNTAINKMLESWKKMKEQLTKEELTEWQLNYKGGVANAESETAGIYRA